MNKQVAIVTGASRGIGRAIALRLAQKDNAVIVNYASNEAEAISVVQRIQDSGGRAHAVQADVSLAGDVRKLFDTADEIFGGVDILVNNAGVMQASPISDVDDEQFERHFAINVSGVFFALREAAKRLRDGGRNRQFLQHYLGAQCAGLCRL